MHRGLRLRAWSRRIVGRRRIVGLRRIDGLRRILGLRRIDGLRLGVQVLEWTLCPTLGHIRRPGAMPPCRCVAMPPCRLVLCLSPHPPLLPLFLVPLGTQRLVLARHREKACLKKAKMPLQLSLNQNGYGAI